MKSNMKIYFSAGLISVISVLSIAGNNIVNGYVIPNPNKTQSKANANKKNDSTLNSKEKLVEYMGLTKNELFKKLGTAYKIVEAGAEGSFEGYNYEKLGLTFVFEDSGAVNFIECDAEVNINGAKAGMKLTEIQQKLGKIPIEKGWYESHDNTTYELNYVFGNCIFTFMSFEKDGTDSYLTVHRKRRPQKVS